MYTHHVLYLINQSVGVYELYKGVLMVNLIFLLENIELNRDTQFKITMCFKVNFYLFF